MKILLIGSGGREHAIAWKLAQSQRVNRIVAVPGNAGIAQVATIRPVSLEPQDLLDLARMEAPDLVVIGPEAPLVAGVADFLAAEGFKVFGPNRVAARLEGSKAFAKEFMERHGVPTAGYRTFADVAEALAYVREAGAPLVVKDSGLAAGKGVTVAAELGQAEAAVEKSLETPGARVVIEEMLEGQELSYLVFTDGNDYLPMPLAQDYKQAGDGDSGPMTGGMGSVAPVRLPSEGERQRIESEVVERTLAGLRADGIEYRGVLYFGLMLTAGGPRLLEYNVRLGDPETQVVLPLLQSDLLDIIEGVAHGELSRVTPDWSDRAAACVVMTAPGYPGEYRKGIPLRPFRPSDDLLLFHAGTEMASEQLVSSGGRVLNVVALGSDVSEAVSAAYSGVAQVEFEGASYRRDIGARLVQEG